MLQPPRTSPADLHFAERRLLQSVVEAAREIFGAAASSVFLIEPESGRLVFEAVSGAGEHDLVGKSFPPGTGIAGWVAASAQTMVIDDVSKAGQFSRDAADATDYVPSSIMAAPLIADSECIGVLEVLDAAGSAHSTLDGADLLALFATQASCGLELLLRLRGYRAAAAAHEDDAAALTCAIDARLRERGPLPPNHAALRLLGLVDEMLGADR